MLDVTAQILDNAQAAYNLGDLAQLEQDVKLALDTAYKTSNLKAVAFSKLLLGLGRRDIPTLESAARIFELRFDWYNVAVTFCVCAEYEPQRARQLAYFQKALDSLERAKRKCARIGDVARWEQVCDVEQAIYRNVALVTNGERWIDARPNAI